MEGDCRAETSGGNGEEETVCGNETVLDPRWAPSAVTTQGDTEGL